jgi:hypothetical protein
MKLLSAILHRSHFRGALHDSSISTSSITNNKSTISFPNIIPHHQPVIHIFVQRFFCRFVREKNLDTCHQAKKLMGSLDAGNRMFDFEKLAEVVSTVTRNLNKVIDINYYPVETARRSNMRHRPIGLGVQGLADTFILLGLPFDSDEAQKLNRCCSKRGCSPPALELSCCYLHDTSSCLVAHAVQCHKQTVTCRDIFEAIYFSALKTSNEIAQEHGPYESYEGSPMSKGIVQPDMWGVSVKESRWDWPALRESIAAHGVCLSSSPKSVDHSESVVCHSSMTRAMLRRKLCARQTVK